MKNNIGTSGRSSRRLNIDRKMTVLLSIFAVLGICLVVSIIIATNTLSGLRGFATLQTNWTEVRKEASLQLVNYIQTGEKRYYSRFDSSLKMIRKAKELRRHLLEKESDYPIVRSGFLEINTIPQDVDNMINTFKYFHDFSDFREAIQQWINSDRLIQEIRELASKSRQQTEKGTFDTAAREQAIQQLLTLDKELTDVQHKLAAALSSGTRFLNTIILWVSISLGFILLATGGFLSFRFSKSLKNWGREMEIREQQYRSLFDQNPNAVYSISKDGRLQDGNNIFEKMTGYSLKELKGEKFVNLVDERELEKVKVHFQKAMEGEPQTYETVNLRRDGQEIYFEITNLPIYVDEEIIGVYGIAQDISERKQAEQKIKEQLGEKTYLLTEIHDRVKNNLALITSLMHLKRETAETDDEKNYLDSTISRIHSMAMVHEQLYHTETFSSIRFDEYIEEFCKSLEKSQSDNKNNEFVLDTDPVTLNINQAITSALLLNELLTNAYKNCPKGLRKGLIRVTLFQERNQIVLKVADNGPGLPDKYDLEDPKTLGLQLVKVLVGQLDASLELDRDGGTCFTICFDNEKKLTRTAIV